MACPRLCTIFPHISPPSPSKMENRPFQMQMSRSPGYHHLLLTVAISILYTAVAAAPQELLLGFKVNPSPSASSFQPILNDPAGNFSLGFLRVNKTLLSLSVVHLPSLQQLWQANPSAATLPRWSGGTQLFFNGSLVVSDQSSGVLWSTRTNGDKVVLLNTSNLQIRKLETLPSSSSSVVWQSFDFPTNTLVEDQNFTSAMTLVSENGIYSFRLGDDFMALHANFRLGEDQMYWKHKALEAKADVIPGQGPIYARVNSDGFLGMYQVESKPVDVQAFNTFQRFINGFLTVRLEPDGNLKGYYWDGANWVLDYQAITETCELPNPCGSYSLCRPGSGCSCLDNRTDYQSAGRCSTADSTGDLCSEGIAKLGYRFRVLRRKGVDLPFKQLMGYKTASSVEECEGICAGNCTCWGAVYNNASGFCYLVDYPIRTVLGVGDETKVGYFKVGQGGAGKKKTTVAFGVLGGAILLLITAVGFGGYRVWRRRRRGVKQMLEEEGGVSAGPYKDLGSASFRSVEMCTR